MVSGTDGCAPLAVPGGGRTRSQLRVLFGSPIQSSFLFSLMFQSLHFPSREKLRAMIVIIIGIVVGDVRYDHSNVALQRFRLNL